MLEESLPVRIRRAYRTMGGAQRRIAEYLLDHSHEAAFLTSTRLGEIIGVSESTVVRLAMSLGYSGYPELQSSIQEALREVARDKSPVHAENGDAPSALSSMKAQLQADLTNLEVTMRTIDEEGLDAAVSLLVEARQVFVMGTRASFTPAYAAWTLMNRILRRASLLGTVGGGLRDEILQIGRDDVLLAIAAPQYAPETLGVIAWASQVGAKTISITDSLLSSAAEKANVVLLFRCLTPNFFNSNIGALAIVHALAAGVIERLKLDPDSLVNDLEVLQQHLESV